MAYKYKKQHSRVTIPWTLRESEKLDPSDASIYAKFVKENLLNKVDSILGIDLLVKHFTEIGILEKSNEKHNISDTLIDPVNLSEDTHKEKPGQNYVPLKNLLDYFSVDDDINLEHIERQLIQICAEEGNVSRDELYKNYISEIESQILSFARTLSKYSGTKCYLEIPREILFSFKENDIHTDFVITKQNTFSSCYLTGNRVCAYCNKIDSPTWHRGPENSILCRSCAHKYTRLKKRTNKELSLEDLKKR